MQGNNSRQIIETVARFLSDMCSRGLTETDNYITCNRSMPVAILVK